jgi:hypothetical protein
MRRRLQVEGLESRALLAGNVSVSVSSGNLSITGDDAANAVSVQQLDTGKYFVTGFSTGGSATSINGQAQGIVVTGVTGNINVDLNGGDDTFVMTQSNARRLDYGGQFGFGAVPASPQAPNTATTETVLTRVPGNLVINTDQGNDNVGVSARIGNPNNSSTGTLNLWTGSENDRVNIDDTIAGEDLLVNTDVGNDSVHAWRARAYDYFYTQMGLGNDRLDISNFHGYHAQFFAGDGDDSVQVVQAQVQAELYINAGNGTNVVKTDAISGQNLTILSGNGNDTILVKSATSRNNFLINSGDGNDSVELNNANVNNQLTVYLLGGDDRLQVAGNKAAKTTLDGGANFDTFVDNGGNSFGSYSKSNFEA